MSLKSKILNYLKEEYPNYIHKGKYSFMKSTKKCGKIRYMWRMRKIILYLTEYMQKKGLSAYKSKVPRLNFVTFLFTKAYFADYRDKLTRLLLLHLSWNTKIGNGKQRSSKQWQRIQDAIDLCIEKKYIEPTETKSHYFNDEKLQITYKGRKFIELIEFIKIWLRDNDIIWNIFFSFLAGAAALFAFLKWGINLIK